MTVNGCNTDVIWQNTNGSLIIWQMNNDVLVSTQPIASPGPTWHVVGNNDFSGDLTNDLLWRNGDGTLGDRGFDVADDVLRLRQHAEPDISWSISVPATSIVSTVRRASCGGTQAARWRCGNPSSGPGTFTYGTIAALPLRGRPGPSRGPRP